MAFANRFAVICGLILFASITIFARAGSRAGIAHEESATARDGQHDFDFDFGRWKVHLKTLPQRLAGSSSWLEYEGTSETQKVWSGRAQLEQFESDGSGGHIEGMTLRLYRPQSHQWGLYWASSKDGVLNQPVIGEFNDERGEFIDQEPFKDRSILVRYVWSRTGSVSPHFEQSFSDDMGKTWEANWITDQTRMSTEDKADSAPKRSAQGPSQDQDGPHDFDFEFGTWKAHLKRLVHPLSGSNTWVEYEGTSVVRKVWDGRANLGELEVANATSNIEGLTLRLYQPQSHQWSLYWANSKDGMLATVPTVGQFKNGRGEFYDQEDFGGKAIFVRFIFSDITPASFHTEQAFSEDGGKTWETNWIGDFTR